MQIATIFRGGFALLSDGTLWCWSDDSSPTCPAQNPVRLQGLPCISSFAADSTHAVAIDDEGGAWVWGERTGGAIVSFPDAQATWAAAYDMMAAWGNRVGGTWWGNDNFLDPAPLEPTTIPLEPVGNVILGAGHGCHLLDGTLRCFGFNEDGELGNGTTGEPFVPVWPPVEVELAVEVVQAVAVSGSRSYALDAEGQLWAWGRPWPGAVDYEPSGPLPKPFLDLPRFVGFTHSSRSACGWTTSGDVWCWGLNIAGHLVHEGGDGWKQPVQLLDLQPAMLVSVDRSGALCSLKLDGTVHCRGFYGRPSYGRPPDGSATIAVFEEES